MTDERCQIVDGLFFPAGILRYFAEFAERVDQLAACQPVRGIQINRQYEFHFRYDPVRFSDLSVKRTEIIDPEPFPDRRMIGIGFSERVFGIHRRERRQTDTGFRHEAKCFQIVMEVTAVRRTVKKKRLFKNGHSQDPFLSVLFEERRTDS